jgi:hypothetical protein
MAEVAFLSYAREDLPFVRALTGALRPDREIAWDQDRDKTIRPAAPWWKEIEAAIRRSGKFILVISPESLASDICGRELRYALSLGKQVLPVALRPPAPEWKPPDDRDDLARVFELQWIFFDDDTAFQASVSELIWALDNDLATSTYYIWLVDRAAERNRPGPTADRCYAAAP